MLTIGKEYDVMFKMPSHPKIIQNDLGFGHTFNLGDFNKKFQKVQPTTTQTMKYKITITSADHTGHEDEKEVFDNLTREELFPILASYSSSGKTILIEPMPEKKKVTVWFYVNQDGKDFWSISKVHFEAIKIARETEINNGRKVSEIQSMEVEI
jgi:hypothetical protein